MFSLPIFSLVSIIILKSRKLRLFRGHWFSHAFKIMLFISDAQYYIPIKLCRTTGSSHLFKIIGMLTPENVKLKKNNNLGYKSSIGL